MTTILSSLKEILEYKATITTIQNKVDVITSTQGIKILIQINQIKL